MNNIPLRDWFAGTTAEPWIAELANMMGCPEGTPLEPHDLTTEQQVAGVKSVRQMYESLPWTERRALIARYKYACADAMMRERVKPTDEFFCDWKDGIWSIKRGTALTVAIIRAIDKARVEGSVVRFRFNEAVITVTEHSLVDVVMNDYYAGRTKC